MAAYSHHFSEWDTAVMIAAMGFGAVAMRGAGCTINDLWDRNMDNKVYTSGSHGETFAYR